MITCFREDQLFIIGNNLCYELNNLSSSYDVSQKTHRSPGVTVLRMTTVFVLTCIFQLLAELLRSKNPEDLQEANRLIKNMVKEVRTGLFTFIGSPLTVKRCILKCW